MNRILKSSILMCLLLSCLGFGQTKYYKVIGQKKILSEENYIQYKKSIANGKPIEEFKLKTEIKKDSIVTYTYVSQLSVTPDGEDPWAEQKKLIGTSFKIDQNKNEKNKNYSKKYILGKPSLVNFWFTTCPPCIEEIPLLNALKQKYNTNTHFISISFNDRKSVENFLQKHEFNFVPITDAKKQIDQMKIDAFPTTFILDKKGIIRMVYGVISEYEIPEMEEILKVLQS